MISRRRARRWARGRTGEREARIAWRPSEEQAGHLVGAICAKW
ncbi:hypothetical protein ACF087_28620 [Streptomyces goshikiensis]